MKPRKILFWLHLSAGVCAGIVILIMSVTGVLLGYERQIVDWGTRGYHAAPPSPDAHHLSADRLLANARGSQPGMIPASITLRSNPEEPASVRFGRDLTVYLNPYTGVVLGEGPKRLQAFFQSVETWHRFLGAADDDRATRRMITGVSNLFFAVLVFSGPFLWWPRTWTPSALRNITFFKKGLSGKARDFNWHNTIGFWCAGPLFIIVMCATVMSFPWANDLLYRMTGSPVPPRPAAQAPNSGAPRTESGQRQRNAPADMPSLDPLWTRAEQQLPDWQSITLRVPRPAEPSAAFTIDQGNGGRPDKRATLTLNIKTADVVRWEPFSSNNAGRRLRNWARWTHTGEAGGIVGQTIAVIVSAGGAFLVWTGLALALRRFRSWAMARSKPDFRRETVAAETITNNQS